MLAHGRLVPAPVRGGIIPGTYCGDDQEEEEEEEEEERGEDTAPLQAIPVHVMCVDNGGSLGVWRS